MNKKNFSVIKKIILLLVIFVFASTVSTFCKPVTKEIQIQTKDARIIKATLSYVKKPEMKRYPTVVLLHSLGYSSDSWGNLINDLNNAGYLVIAVDLRGHGKSVLDSTFHKKSWTYFTIKTYSKFPSDVLSILNEAQKQAKNVDLDNMAIVGADIGANTAVLVTKELKKKPKTLVLISPTTSFKGLYIPIAMAEMGNIPILTMVSKKDKYCLQQQQELAKFSQGGFYAKNYPDGGMGMIMLKVNPTMSQDITKWIARYLH
ncbi:MAG: alpha/beta fold hydrolase [Candidatus Gastranaerophilales bacterium]|nr:alpha/beta fold hydrolase [Candidatus Gastranaerophilales bacterium]